MKRVLEKISVVKSVLCSLIVLIFYGISAFWIRLPARAQVIQPTGQSSPVTRNPQVIGSPSLGAPVTPLQGSGGPQVLGAYFNQFANSSLEVSVPKTSNILNAPSASDDPLASIPKTADESTFHLHKLVVPVVAGLTLFLGVLAIVLASKKRNSDIS